MGIQDSRLAARLRKYESRIIKEMISLSYLMEHTKEENLRTLVLNFDVALQHTGNISNNDVREKIRTRLMWIQRCIGEIDELGGIMHDLEQGEVLHADLLLLRGIITKYFDGGKTDDGVEFKGLDKTYKDKKLRQTVFQNPNVIRLFNVTQFIQRTKEELAFISEGVQELEKAERSGTWKGFLGKGGFFDKIGGYAEKFEQDFNNPSYAKIFIAGKEKIGQQPHVWLGLLRNLQKRGQETLDTFLGKIEQKKNELIFNVRNFLHVAFATRRDELSRILAKIAQNAHQLISSHESIGLLKDLEEIIKRFEKIINKIWHIRKKRFAKLRDRLQTIYFNLTPKLQSRTEEVDILNELYVLYQSGETYKPYVTQTHKLFGKMRRLPYVKSDILTSIFFISRFYDINKAVVHLMSEIENKIKTSQENKTRLELRRLVLEAIRIIYEIIQFIKTLNLAFSTDIVEQKIKVFITEEYYGEAYGRTN